MALSNYKLESPKFEEVSTEQMLEAQTHIWKHMFSFINSTSLNCVIQLGIPDIIHSHGKPMALSQLVGALHIDNSKSQCICRLMRLLTHSKFFVTLNNPGAISEGEGEEGEEFYYWLTPASHFLLKDGALTVAPIVRLIFDPIMTKSLDYMSEWIVSGERGSPFEEAHGRVIWELARQDSGFNNMFNQAMSCDSGFVMHVLLKECKKVFEGIELMVDVGGGDGTAAKAIIHTISGIKCIVLDLPHVVAGLEDSNNLTYIGGDMFQTIPSADAILLKSLLHDWKDEESIKILKKCKQAITNGGKVGGKVIIIDLVLDDFGKEEMQVKLSIDISMMACVNSKERSEKEWAKLFNDAGFTSYKINPSLGMRSVIELYP